MSLLWFLVLALAIALAVFMVLYFKDEEVKEDAEEEEEEEEEEDEVKEERRYPKESLEDVVQQADPIPETKDEIRDHPAVKKLNSYIEPSLAIPSIAHPSPGPSSTTSAPPDVISCTDELNVLYAGPSEELRNLILAYNLEGRCRMASTTLRRSNRHEKLAKLLVMLTNAMDVKMPSLLVFQNDEYTGQCLLDDIPWDEPWDVHVLSARPLTIETCPGHPRLLGLTDLRAMIIKPDYAEQLLHMLYEVYVTLLSDDTEETVEEILGRTQLSKYWWSFSTKNSFDDSVWSIEEDLHTYLDDNQVEHKVMVEERGTEESWCIISRDPANAVFLKAMLPPYCTVLEDEHPDRNVSSHGLFYDGTPLSEALEMRLGLGSPSGSKTVHGGTLAWGPLKHILDKHALDKHGK